MLIPPAKSALTVTAAVALAVTLMFVGSSWAQEASPDTTSSSVDTTASAEAASEPEKADAPAESDAGEVSPASEAAPEDRSELSVLRAYVCRGIDQSEPTEAGKSFIPAPDGVLRLCCFSEVAGPPREGTVVHVWYWGEREMARVRLSVRGPRWRTWSTKRVLDEWRGEWHVDITDGSGVLLSRLRFSVE